MLRTTFDSDRSITSEASSYLALVAQAALTIFMQSGHGAVPARFDLNAAAATASTIRDAPREALVRQKRARPSSTRFPPPPRSADHRADVLLTDLFNRLNDTAGQRPHNVDPAGIDRGVVTVTVGPAAACGGHRSLH